MSERLSIVVADVNEETRLALVETVIALDPSARVIEAADGIQLDAALAGGAVDLVFIDVLLPDMRGSRLADWRRARGRLAMIVLLTDMLAPNWASAARRFGAYDVILRPLHPHQVERTLRASRIVRRTLRLLVVEPRAATRDLIARLVRHSCFGLRAVGTEGGREAVRLARREPFDMAIIEFGLGDYPALEVACQLNLLHPEAKILLSGFGIEGPARPFAPFGVSGLLRKPFGLADLDRAVHEVHGLSQPYLELALEACARSGEEQTACEADWLRIDGAAGAPAPHAAAR